MPSTKMDSLGCIYIYSYTQLYETLIIKKEVIYLSVCGKEIEVIQGKVAKSGWEKEREGESGDLYQLKMYWKTELQKPKDNTS